MPARSRDLGADPSRWREGEPSPRWYVWEGGFMAVGRSGGVVPVHDHHAIQVVLSLDGVVGLRGPGEEWRDYRGAIVRADAPHSFDGRGQVGCMLFVDPDSSEGRWLADGLRDPVTAVPDGRLERCLPPLRDFLHAPLEAMDTAELVLHTVSHLCAGPRPTRTMDSRVAEALRFIRSVPPASLDLPSVAKSVFLSPSRFAHLFTDHVGLPFRRYLLWRKVGLAMVAVARGRSLTAAAHDAGFSDSAHLTRTFKQMFGIPPSVMMRGDFYVIPPPFELP